MPVSTAGAGVQKNTLSILDVVLIQSDKRLPGLELPACVWHEFSHLGWRMVSYAPKPNTWEPLGRPMCRSGAIKMVVLWKFSSYTTL